MSSPITDDSKNVTEKTMTYQITVSSLGYDDHIKVVHAESLRQARQQERLAKVEWMDLNAIDFDDDTLKLPSAETIRVKQELTPQ